MKTTLNYIVRAICAVVGTIAFFVLVGEPTEELTMAYCVISKGISALVIWLAVKVYMLTLSKEEKKEFEDERA